MASRAESAVGIRRRRDPFHEVDSGLPQTFGRRGLMPQWREAAPLSFGTRVRIPWPWVALRSGERGIRTLRAAPQARPPDQPQFECSNPAARWRCASGERGIRTLERGQPPLHDFQSCPFNRSGTSPWRAKPSDAAIAASSSPVAREAAAQTCQTPPTSTGVSTPWESTAWTSTPSPPIMKSTCTPDRLARCASSSSPTANR